MTYTAGDLVRARARDWVVLEGSASDFLLLRPLDGEEWEETGVHLALEPVEKLLAPTQEQEYDKEALVASLRELLRSFTQENFTASGNFTGSWEYMAFGAAMYGNMLLGALQGLGCDPKEELQRARVTSE